VLKRSLLSTRTTPARQDAPFPLPRSRIVQTFNIPRQYDSGLHSLRACWTDFLNILRDGIPVVQHIRTIEALTCESHRTLLDDGRGGVKHSLVCSGGGAGVERGLIRLICCLGLDKSMQALVLLGGTNELEGDAASAHRTDHRGHFKGKFAFTER
jgi:hypothetical protein